VNGHEAQLDRLAFAATRHCLTGCAIGEVVGFVVAGALALEMLTGMALAIALAFAFGYSLTFFPLLRSGMPLAGAVRITVAADTISILVMEAVDNAVILAVPGAMEAGLFDALFWLSLVAGFAVAFPITLRVNRALIARGQGHAVVHQGGH
jgi:Na+-transporting NADH:ubiquinone oxidoreductase subunit NqrD